MRVEIILELKKLILKTLQEKSYSWSHMWTVGLQITKFDFENYYIWFEKAKGIRIF